MFKKITKFALLVFVIYLSYSFGYYNGYEDMPSEKKISGVLNKETQIENVDFQIFWDTWKELERKYVDRKDINRQDMVYGAISGMVNAVGDPYTNFFAPESAKIFKEDIDGSFSGIGAEIGFRKGLLTIISPLKDSPAQKAGIKAGDVIVKVDGESTVDMSLEEAVLKIRGPKGEKVTLTILREGLEDLKDITIVRDTIQIPTIEYEIKEQNIGYIKLYNFTGDASPLFKKYAKELKNQGAERFIVDLRNNPGGFLDAAIEIASTMVPKGEVITIESFGGKKSDRKFRSKGYGYLQDVPLVILINEGSASASEIVAGAAKGKDKIKIVGKKSFGKGSVQEVVDITEDTFLKVTIAKWLTPDGMSIQDNGIEPDIEVDDSEDPKEDPQLKKAIEVVKSL